MAFVKYVGKKDVQIDSLYGSFIQWNGKGDVQEVPDGLSPLLKKHPDCYEVIEATKDQPAPPDNVNDRIQQIVGVIESFDEKDKSLWTKAGKPEVRAIIDVLGYDITASQRDEAIYIIDLEDS